MAVQRTIKVFVPSAPELVETVHLYNSICNEHIGFTIEAGGFVSKNKLHIALYHAIREKYPSFPSALIQCARDHAVEAIRGNGGRKCTFKKENSCARFDKRTFKALLESGQLQLTTVSGRKKYQFHLPDYFRKYVGWKVVSCNIGIKKRSCMVCLTVEGETPVKTGDGDVLGIDLGLKNIAACSDNHIINSKHLRGVKRRYQYTKRNLQSCGTRSAKRHLQRLSGRERRFTTNENHCLAKMLANKPYGAFAVEDLTGIREQRKGKTMNRMLSNWSFYQLRQFIHDKAEEKGKEVIIVDPRFTSQRCSRCGLIDKKNRDNGRFKCISCGFELSADLNASRNISLLGAALFSSRSNASKGRPPVNGPIVAPDEASPLHNEQCQGQLQASLLVGR